jgi:hypothetical protein
MHCSGKHSNFVYRVLQKSQFELSMSEEIDFMISRYPAFKERILNAYKDSDEFKGLCDDFYSSSKKLEDYKEKVIKDIKNELEYRKLFLDLENEILKFLGTGQRKENRK